MTCWHELGNGIRSCQRKTSRKNNTHTHTYYTAEDQDYDYREDEDDGYVKGYGDNNVGIRRA
jgi:hypothetical protein